MLIKSINRDALTGDIEKILSCGYLLNILGYDIKYEQISDMIKFEDEQINYDIKHKYHLITSKLLRGFISASQFLTLQNLAHFITNMDGDRFYFISNDDEFKLNSLNNDNNIDI